jgi:hypothetical protein
MGSTRGRVPLWEWDWCGWLNVIGKKPELLVFISVITSFRQLLLRGLFLKEVLSNCLFNCLVYYVLLGIVVFGATFRFSHDTARWDVHLLATPLFKSGRGFVWAWRFLLILFNQEWMWRLILEELISNRRWWHRSSVVSTITEAALLVLAYHVSLMLVPHL